MKKLEPINQLSKQLDELRDSQNSYLIILATCLLRKHAFQVIVAKRIEMRYSNANKAIHMLSCYLTFNSIDVINQHTGFHRVFDLLGLRLST